MNDKRLSDLFTEGTAPEHDPAFALRVAAEVGRVRRRARLLTMAYRLTWVPVLAGAIFVTGRLIELGLAQLRTWLPQLVDEQVPQFMDVAMPRFMGVPLPVVLGVLVAWLLLRGRRWPLPFRHLVALLP